MSNKVEVDMATAKHLVIIRTDDGVEWYEINGSQKAHEFAMEMCGRGKYVMITLLVRQLYGMETKHLEPRT